MITENNGYTNSVEISNVPEEKAFGQLQEQLEYFMQQARPGLLRQTTQFGIAAEQTEDVVQETLLQAWRHLAELRAPELFHAWLHGICRNICLNWQRTKSTQFERSHLLISQLLVDEDGQGVDIPDHGGVFDPVEELQRQDLEILLDRALSHLPEQARRGIELYYLEELPQKEVALHLGTNEKTFKVQLHRARKQLWHILHTDLRTEAQAFGLTLETGQVLSPVCKQSPTHHSSPSSSNTLAPDENQNKGLVTMGRRP